MGIACCVAKDGSATGEITFDDWIAVKTETNAQKKAEMLKPIFARIDVDNSKSIRKAELRKFFTELPGSKNAERDKKIADDLFSKMDGNHDDKITFEELLKYMTD